MKKPPRNLGDWSGTDITMFLEMTAMMLSLLIVVRLSELYL
jgi:hypothetical protein